MNEPVLCVALPVERLAVRRAAASVHVLSVGMGARRSSVSLLSAGRGALLVAGVAGALADDVEPGDLVVADSLLLAGEDGAAAGPRIEVPAAVPIAAALRAVGLRTKVGPVVTSPRIVSGDARRRLARSGAVAVDMESYTLAAAAPARRLAVVRAVVDTPSAPLGRPGTVRRGLVALRNLRRAVPALEEWAGSAPSSPFAQEVV